MIGQGLVWLTYTDYVVLDEADRMLDMGFEEELLRIHKELPGTQQTLLFTATLMPEVIRVAEKYGKDYLKLVVGKELSPADTISHFVVPVAPGRKLEALVSVLRMHAGKTIVFFNTIKDVIHFSTELRKYGLMECTGIHSGKTQEQRNRAISDLREGRLKTLLGTDVAARGIDIPQVELVVNYDLPNNPEEYIHRIGRTGRAGYTGTALSFLGPRDAALLEGVESVLKHAIPRETRFPFAMKDGEARHEEHPAHGHGDRPRPHRGGRGGGPRRHGPGRPARPADGV
jgi:ATP-dependent RNA helicase RhlE